MRQIIKKLKKEDGTTLVEMLAAIAILSIIVTAFLAFFVQAGRTNNMTTEVNEATFLAQERIEEITHLSPNRLDEVETLPEIVNGYKIQTKIEPKKINETDEFRMNQVIVIVKEGDDTRAQMETWLPLEEERNDEE